MIVRYTVSRDAEPRARRLIMRVLLEMDDGDDRPIDPMETEYGGGIDTPE